MHGPNALKMSVALLASLSGVALGAPLNPAPPALTFGPIIQGNPVPDQAITYTNVSGGVVLISSFVLVGPDWAQFGDTSQVMAPLQLAAGASIQMSIGFFPQGVGQRNATYRATLRDNMGNMSTLDVPLTGTVVLAGKLQLGVGAVGFGNMPVGMPSQPAPVTITNGGAGDLHLSQITLGGMNPGDFIVDLTALPMPQNGVYTVIPMQTVTINVVFKPLAVGARSATLSITSDDPGHPKVAIPLSGTGTLAILSTAPKLLDFGMQPVAKATPAQSAFVINTGNGAANIIAVMIVGPEAAWFQLNGALRLPLPVPPMNKVIIDVVATAARAGAGQATLAILTDDPKTPSFQIPLTVTGIDPGLIADMAVGRDLATGDRDLGTGVGDLATGDLDLGAAARDLRASSIDLSQDVPPLADHGCACAVTRRRGAPVGRPLLLALAALALVGRRRRAR